MDEWKNMRGRSATIGRVFIDDEAFSQNAEYRRFLDGDYLGKLLFKSFLVRRVGVPADSRDLDIPPSRYGRLGDDSRCVPDATLVVDDVALDIEIKLARVNIADARRGGTAENWAFGNLLRTPGKAERHYDLAVAIGVLTLGHEHPDYWKFESELDERFAGLEVHVHPEAMPHEPSYLNRCGFFVFDHDAIDTNFFRVNIQALPENKRFPYFAWGHDAERCRAVWDRAVASALDRRKASA